MSPDPARGMEPEVGPMPHALGQAGSTAGDKWGERMDGAPRRARIPRDLNPPALRRYLYSHRHSPAKSVKDPGKVPETGQQEVVVTDRFECSHDGIRP